jgi:hypothetical protein
LVESYEDNMTTKDENFIHAPRKKIDVRLSAELDDRIEEQARKLGTTKNSIVLIGALTFVAKLELLAADHHEVTAEVLASLVAEALRELVIVE